MKNKVILVIALLALVVIGMIPVMAWDIPNQTNTSMTQCSVQDGLDFAHSTLLGNLYPGETFPYINKTQECIDLGYTSAQAADYLDIFTGCYTVYPAFGGVNAIQRIFALEPTNFTITEGITGLPIWENLVCDPGGISIKPFWYWATTGARLPVASFTAVPDSGYQPLTVNFTDTSTGINITITQWDFGDGYYGTNLITASHIYHLNGTYNASLTVANDGGSSTAFKNITVGEAPAIPGSFNLTVHVKDKSGVNINGAHISLLPSSGPVLTNYTNNAGISHFAAVPGSAAAIIDVTKVGYPEWVEAFTLASDMTKEITLGPTGIKFYVDVKDSIYGSYIDNINFGVKNTTSGIWRNVTGHSGAIYVDSTGASYEYPLSIGQTVIVAASKAGYLPDWKSFTITQADPVQTVTLHLVNINGSAPSSGNFTAVIAAASMITGLEIPGASITINELGRMQATNGAGVAMFYSVPVGSYTLLVGASGYQSATSDITGTSLETVMKRVDLLPNGFHQGENGTITDPDGNPYQPWNPDYGDGHGGYIPGVSPVNATASAANEKAANAITIFLDNAVAIGSFVLLGLAFWFGKKILFT